MLFLRSWLEEYIDLSNYSNKELADIITAKSSEVEEIKVIRDYFGGKVVVGQIKNVRSHPDASRLQIFDVVIGSDKKIQIVSAASNVCEDLLVPVALEGAKLPNGLTIMPRKMRGEESQGMCCGMSELMLETNPSSGLWELESEFGIAQKSVILGQSICNAFPSYFPEEVVLDIKVLPNRVGVFGSYLGMAFEIAICLENRGLLKRKASRLLDCEIFLDDVRNQLNFASKTTDPGSTKFQDNTDYTNSMSLFNVTFKISETYYLPHEIQKKMYLTGINMIGGFADVSNYLLYDVGQPTHFFSQAKLEYLAGSKEINWTVKSLDKESQFEGLGQLKNTTLPIGTKVIVDEKDNILALPGISGGRSTSLEAEETNFIMEVANFSSDDVSRASFALKYRSDGSKIWSGKVNQELLFVTLLHFQELLGDYVSINPVLFWTKNDGMMMNIDDFLIESNQVRIPIDIKRLADQLDDQGLDHWKPIIESKLQLLGNYEHGTITTEAFYSNIETEQDILEELLRLVGYDSLQPQSLITGQAKSQSSNYSKVLFLKHVLTDFGFDEVITRPFVSEDRLEDVQKAPRLIKPYRSNEPFLRDSLLGSLVDLLSQNIKEGHKEPRIFEINSKFTQVAGFVKESKELEAVFISQDPYLATSIAREIWNKTSRKPVGGYEEISDLSEKVGKGVYLETNSEKDTWITVREISNSLKKKFGLPLSKKVWSVNVFLDHWDMTVFPYKIYKDESEYPGVKRSYTLTVNQNNSWTQIQSLLQKISVNGVDVSFVPVERVVVDTKETLTVSVDFVSYEKTLTSEDIAGFEMLMKLALDNIRVVIK